MVSISMALDDLLVMTNNSRAVVDLLVVFLTVFSHNILTLLNVGGVDNSLTDWSWNLVGLVFWDLVTLLLHMFLTLGF